MIEVINVTYNIPMMIELTNSLNKLFILLLLVIIGLIVSFIIEIWIEYRLRLIEIHFRNR